MKTFFLLLVAVNFASSASFAQLVQNDIAAHSIIVKYNDVTKMGDKINKDYKNVHGKYLWDKDWHRGMILMKPGNVIKLKQMKVNFLTQEVQYPSGNVEMAAAIDNMKTVVLFQNEPGDTTAIAATFEVIRNIETRTGVNVAKTKYFFYEVMNKGNVQLLKRTLVGTNKMRSDAIIEGDIVYFYPSNDYLIRVATTVMAIKKLNKSNIFRAFPDAAHESGWLLANHNTLKTEEEVAAFFDHLNSLQP